MGSPSLFHLSITLTIVLAVLISFSCSTGAIKGSKNVFGSITNFRQYFEEEIRYRRSSYEQYRDDIKRRVWNAVENFRHKKTNQKPIKKNQLDFYVEKYYKLYNDTLNEYTQRKQQLKNVQLYERPNAIDNSLEDFKKFYNASIFNQLQIKAPAPKSVKIKIDEDSFTKQLEQLQLSISANWESILTSTKASAIKAEEVVKNAMVEFEKINSEINVNSNLLEDSILHFPGLSKEELKAQAQRIEEQIAKVDRKGSEWIEDRIKTLDLAFKSLQEKVKKVDAMYDQLVGKRQAGVYYTYMNDKTLKRVLEMIDETDDCKYIKCITIHQYSVVKLVMY